MFFVGQECEGLVLSKESDDRFVGEPSLGLGKTLAVKQWIYVSFSFIGLLFNH